MHYQKPKRLRYFIVFTLSGAFLTTLVGALLWALTRPEPQTPTQLNRQQLSQKLTPRLEQGDFPETLSLPRFRNASERAEMRVTYTVDPILQLRAEKLLSQYKPDHGSVVAIDVNTGAVLAMASYNREATPADQLATRALFPAASIFKIITAAAAIDQGKAYSETQISYNGSNHTLYKRNVEDQNRNRWTRTVTLREAFARSINTVFGKVGLFRVGADDLLSYAEKFYFNREIPSDVEVDVSRVILDPRDQWALAESSAGFTRRTTLSPMHGALLAAAIANDGELRAPYLVDSIVDPLGRMVYRGASESLGSSIVPYSAQQMRLLMNETVMRGTSRKIFRGFGQQDHDIQVGGKTGSLDGDKIQGRTDWFVGYASNEGRSIAVGIVTVHRKYWTVKSSYLARMIFEEALREPKRAVASEVSRR